MENVQYHAERSGQIDRIEIGQVKQRMKIVAPVVMESIPVPEPTGPYCVTCGSYDVSVTGKRNGDYVTWYVHCLACGRRKRPKAALWAKWGLPLSLPDLGKEMGPGWKMREREDWKVEKKRAKQGIRTPVVSRPCHHCGSHRTDTQRLYVVANKKFHYKIICRSCGQEQNYWQGKMRRERRRHERLQ